MENNSPLLALDVIGARMGTIAANIATMLGFAFYIRDRTSTLPPSSLPRLDIVLHLGLLTAIGYGVLWAILEKCFKTNYGAGANGMPNGWSAVVLSFSVNISLALIPFIYQLSTGMSVLTQRHWLGMIIVMILSIIFYLLIYGIVPPQTEGFKGLREYIVPAGKHEPFWNSIFMEMVYAILFISLPVFAYRLIINPGGSLIDTVLGRAILPGMVFVSAMAIFIGLKYPDSMDEPIWIQVRGIVGAIVMMICLCGGLFV